MKIYVYVDGDDFEEVAESMASSLADWTAKAENQAELVSYFEETTEKPAVSRSDKDLGITINVKRPVDLKEPLNFLYGLAKENKQEFVLGITGPDTGEPEDICYFGFEEGKPDIYEIANYIEL